MSETLRIPADMIDHERSEECGETVVSARNLMILLGATDEQLRDSDERREILEREPWRTAGLKFEPICEGSDCGFMTGSVDWSGTRFAK